jgi:GNAT superfamily N-acetyltransferase
MSQAESGRTAGGACQRRAPDALQRYSSSRERRRQELADAAERHLPVVEEQDVLMNNVSGAFVVRAAGEADLSAVLRVLSRAGSQGSALRYPSDLERQAWARMMRTVDLTVYLGEIDGEPIATAALLIMPHLTYECAPTAFIEAVVVVPEHRRKGFATELVQRALSDARELGCNKVQLLSHKRHVVDGAHRLYEKLGFEPEAEGFRLYLQQVPPVVQTAQVR